MSAWQPWSSICALVDSFRVADEPIPDGFGPDLDSDIGTSGDFIIFLGDAGRRPQDAVVFLSTAKLFILPRTYSRLHVRAEMNGGALSASKLETSVLQRLTVPSLVDEAENDAERRIARRSVGNRFFNGYKGQVFARNFNVLGCLQTNIGAAVVILG